MICRPPLYSMNPSFLNLFMKKLREDHLASSVRHRPSRCASRFKIRARIEAGLVLDGMGLGALRLSQAHGPSEGATRGRQFIDGTG